MAPTWAVTGLFKLQGIPQCRSYINLAQNYPALSQRLVFGLKLVVFFLL